MRMTYSSRIGADLRYQVMREGLDGEPRNSNGKGISARDSRARMRARAFRLCHKGGCVRIGAGTRKYARPDAHDSPHQVLPLARCASRS